MTDYLHIDGTIRRRVDMLRIGDRIDLEGDKIADPDKSDDFVYEFTRVESVKLETPDCVLVETSQGCFGFPPGHMIEVDAEQVLPGLSRRKPLTEQRR